MPPFLMNFRGSGSDQTDLSDTTPCRAHLGQHVDKFIWSGTGWLVSYGSYYGQNGHFRDIEISRVGECGARKNSVDIGSSCRKVVHALRWMT